MSIASRQVGSELVIELSDRIDLSNHKCFQDTYSRGLENDAIKTINIDMSGVNYLDSSTLGMMLVLKEKVEKADKEIVISRPSKNVNSILEVSNFRKLFKII